MILNKIGKIQLFYYKEVLNRIHQKNISLSLCTLNNNKEVNYSADAPKNTQKSLVENEDIYLQPVPKKKYGLSEVEEKDLEVVDSLRKGNLFYPYKTPYERCAKIMAEDFKCTFRRMFYNVTGVKLGPTEPVYFPRYTDVLIVGGGILGLTIAFTLRSRFPHGCEIIVVDKDPNFPSLSTSLAQALVTHQLFTDEEEIPMLKYGAEFFSSFSRNTETPGLAPLKLSYEPLGSLLLVDSSNVDETLKKAQALKKHEMPNKILDIETLKRKFPWLNTENLLFGSLGMGNEGLVDPWAYLLGLKNRCLNLGVTFATAEVIDFGFHNYQPGRVVCKLPDGSYNSINFARCVLACGMEALNLTEKLNSSDDLNLVVKLPLQERVRYEYCFYNPEGPGLNTPIVIDPSGTYFRREGLTGHYVAGVLSLPFSGDEENDPRQIYENKVKPFLTKRVSKFEDSQLVRGWVDLQEYCHSNDVGILGLHPEVETIIYALGFSHLGLQYLPAVGRAVVELLTEGEYRTIDFTPFHIENLWRKQHLEAEKARKELLESSRRVAISK